VSVPEERAGNGPRTVDADQFAALCNLFCLTESGGEGITAAEIGDILYFRAHPMVCDHSRLMTRAVLAYLGFRNGDPAADELISEVHAAMRNGEGSLADEETA
jgi:hypothetical protein